MVRIDFDESKYGGQTSAMDAASSFLSVLRRSDVVGAAAMFGIRAVRLDDFRSGTFNLAISGPSRSSDVLRLLNDCGVIETVSRSIKLGTYGESIRPADGAS